jgi:hypothetical protein
MYLAYNSHVAAYFATRADYYEERGFRRLEAWWDKLWQEEN